MHPPRCNFQCRKNYCTIVVYFSIISYCTSLYNRTERGISVKFTSQVHSSTITDCTKLRIKILGNTPMTISIQNFVQIHVAILCLNNTDRQADWQKWSGLYAFVPCTSCKEHKISICCIAFFSRWMPFFRFEPSRNFRYLSLAQKS